MAKNKFLAMFARNARKRGARTLGTGGRVVTYKKRGLRTSSSHVPFSQSLTSPPLLTQLAFPHLHHTTHLPSRTMKLTFKDLQQKKFTIDVEPTDTVILPLLHFSHSCYCCRSLSDKVLFLDFAGQAKDPGIRETRCRGSEIDLLW